MDNPENIQLMTTSRSREDDGETRPLELSEDAQINERVTVSRKRFVVTVVLLTAIIVALLAALVIGMLVSKSGNEKAQKLETCWTKECVELTSMLKNYQNSSVDPCDDFFEHTCGLLYQHTLDDSSISYQQYKRLVHQVHYMVTKTPKFDSKSSQQMKIFAEKCADRSGMDEDTFEELRKDIDRRGGFPFMDQDWDESKFDFSDMLANYIKLNRKRLGFLSVEPYPTIENNKSVNYLYVSPGPHFVYANMMSLDAFRNGVTMIMRRLAKLENQTLDEPKFEAEYQKCVDLEKRMVDLADYVNMDYDTDNINKAKTLKELAEYIPELDWFKIIKAMVRDDVKNRDEVEKVLVERVKVHGAGEYFFGKERELAKIITETPKPVLANYLVMRHLVDLALYFYDKDQPKQSKFYGNPTQKKFCATQLALFFPMPSMNVYIQKSGYEMENLKLGAEMFERVKGEYEKIFKENSYLEPEVREFLLMKLKKINGSFAHQLYIEPSKLLEELYENLNLLETDTPFQIYMKLWRHRTETLADHIVHDTPLDPVNLKQFALHAAYQSFSNTFYINIAFLMFPWMDVSLPSSGNYGYLGFVIGHEIGHAFDYFHRRIDGNGQHQKIWVTKTNSSNEEYGRREKCLRDQYSNYIEPGYDFLMNGTHSRLEIAGDHMGLRTAYRAFKQAEKTDTVKLPGLQDLTEDQLFFYNYALRQCDISNSGVSGAHLKLRFHPTNRFRVNGVVQNLPEFSEAFKCSKTSKLNLKEKCQLY